MKRFLSCLLCLALFLTAALSASAERLNELKVAPDKGIADTINYVNQLDDIQTALYIGAHPDDESNSLLVYLNRAVGLDCIYATLNWGEGGDNSIGSELYGALGALRSRELSSSRQFDNSVQMYLGGVDFGYSVSLKESLLGDAETDSEGIYNIDILGYNYAKVIRTVRPDVVFSSHKAPNTDHGQHRAAGWMCEYGIDLAADPNYVIYGDNGAELPAFQVKKLYVRPYSANQVNSYPDQITSVGVNSKLDPTAADLTLNLGAYDTTLGMSYNEWGVLGRNMHKCQKMISAPSKAASVSTYLLKKADPNAVIDDTFSGELLGGIAVVTVDDLDKVFGEIDAVKTLCDNIHAFQDGFKVNDIAAGGEYLAKAKEACEALKVEAAKITDASKRADAVSYMENVSRHITKVVQEIYALDVDISVSDADAVPGQTITVTSTLWARNASADAVGIPTAAFENGIPTAITMPEGWTAVENSVTDCLSGDTVVGRTFVYDVTIPNDYKVYTGPYNGPYDEEYTNPFYPAGAVINGKQRVELIQDSQNPSVTTAEMVATQNAYEDLAFGITTCLTDPYAHAPIAGVLNAKILGAAYEITNEPTLRIVPKLSAIVSNNANMLKYTGSDIETYINVVLSNNMVDDAKDVVLTAYAADENSGIKAEAMQVSVAAGSMLSATLKVTVPASYINQSTELVVTATLNGETYSEGYQVISYDHIDTVNYYRKAAQSLSVIEYGLPDDEIRIGFLKAGYDDYVYDYIKAMYADPAKANQNLRELTTADIAKSGAELAAQYDTIVVGKTALPNQSPIATELRACFQNLLDYANNGGNLVMHYQNYRVNNEVTFAPVPFPMASANINKEDCTVFVNPAAAATDFYRGIDLKLDGEKSGASIWDGWNQQRCEWTPGTAGEGQVEAMEALGYTVLFEGQDPEGFMRPAILYMDMDNGGHYTYSAVVWERQLQNLVPGAYLLYANLISIGYGK